MLALIITVEIKTFYAFCFHCKFIVRCCEFPIVFSFAFATILDIQTSFNFETFFLILRNRM